MTDSYLTTANRRMEKASRQIKPKIVNFNTVGMPDKS